MAATANAIGAYRRELVPTAPYAFDLALAYLRSSPSAILERVDEASATYRRALTVAGRDALLVITSVGTVEAPRLILEVRGALGGDGASCLAAAERKARALFALDEDPAAFLALHAVDPVFGALLRRFHGLRPVLIADPFEALIWGVIGQQVNVAFARKLKLTLVGLWGRRLCIDGVEYPLLPAPADLAGLDPAVLMAHQFSRQKASYVVGLAQAVTTGELDFEALRGLPHEEAIAALTRFRGVGRWTAEYVLMRGLGERDSIPAADLGLRAIVGRAYRLGRKATEAELRGLAERWAGWRGWAAFHWWHALQTGDIGESG